MFVLQVDPRWSWPVRVRVPVDGGRYEDQVFDATFVLVDERRVRELTDADPSGRTLLEVAVADWAGVVEADKRPVPYTTSALSAMIGIPFVRAALLEAYRDSITGAARKN